MDPAGAQRSDGPATAKEGLRRKLRAQRRSAQGRPAAVAAGLLRTATAAGLLSIRGRPGEVGPVRLAAYLAWAGEPDVAEIVSVVREHGGTVLLPIPHRGGVLGWAAAGAGQSRSRRLPVPIPAGPEIGNGASALRDAGIGLILAPALAAAHGGVRLGNGGGYYDRLLADLDGAILALAVVHDEEVLPAADLPRERHDALVAGVLTPTRVMRWDR